jgi:hypothetical protein
MPQSGALKAEAIPLIAGCLGLNNAADGSLRLAPWVKIDEKLNRSSSDLFFKYQVLIYFHAKFRY